MNLLAKVDSHAHVGSYFGNYLNCSLNDLKRVECMCDQAVGQCEGKFHVSLLRNYRFKAYAPFPFINDYRHFRKFTCIKGWLFYCFDLELTMRRSGGWVIRPTTSLSLAWCKGSKPNSWPFLS